MDKLGGNGERTNVMHPRLLMICGLFLLLAACQNESRSFIEVGMYNPDGDMIGTAKLTEKPEGVQVKLSVEGLEPGPHGIHIHEYPKCEGPDFTSAGNHFNPTGKMHGLMNAEGAHIGDMPNVEPGETGLAEAELMVAEATLKDGKNSLVKGEGTSIVIHAGPDDGMSQPSGDSGERIACGVIQLNKDGELPTDPTEQNKKKEK
ncbi:superoxide dismutase family protein [Thalassobacillus hwangdonensis]|uniref:Superoxide dismutase [Cu-Zn] n=1 Tax=Thalassobacillus hwangdonensis TaxID=546108 RepID=A0ABW3L5Z5_9BACI